MISLPRPRQHRKVYDKKVSGRVGFRKVFNDKPAQAWAVQERKTLWRLFRKPSPAVSVCVLSLYQSPFSVSTTFVRLAKLTN